MLSKKFIFLALVVASIGVGSATAQDIIDALRLVSSKYASRYIEPFTSAFGADYNTGLFHTADNGPRKGLHGYFGIKVFATLIDGSDKRFSTTYTVDVAIDRIVGGKAVTLRAPALVTVRDAPTIFGDSLRGSVTVRVLDDIRITVDGEEFIVAVDTVFTFKTPRGLIDLPLMPAAAPQLEIGTFLGTDVMVRYVPSITSEDIGRFGLFGGGIRHSISQYFPSLPFHLAIQGVGQRLFFDDDNGNSIIELTTWAVNLQASKKFGGLTVYGSVQAEDANIKISYVFDSPNLIENGQSGDEVAVVDAPDPVTIGLDLDGANLFRGIIGLSVKAGPVLFSVDANLGTVRTGSFGIGVTF